jgi:hypothetical protein
MAQTIPTTLPSKASQGEHRLFAVLKRLPNEVVVYYEPIIDNRNPDFVVVLPTLGVLLIEVKGWYLPDIIAGDTHAVRVRDGDREVEHVHPLRQVADYKYRLMKVCANDRKAFALVNPDGRYAGKFQFPFASFAVLSNITRENLNKMPAHSRAVFPPATVATRDQLIAWEMLDLVALIAVFKGYFDTFIAPMTQNQINIVKAILHPEILLGLDLSQPEEPQVKVLDLKQEGLARDVGDGHRLIFGVAGSGKTVLLTARAKLIARFDPGAKILVLCYNVALAALLTEALKDFRAVTVMTFHRWAGRNGLKWDGEEDAQLGEALLTRLKAGAPDSGRYDTILIDEAQDFDPTWYPCVLAAMKDPLGGDLLIVGDGSQGLYNRQKVSWKQLGIQAAGRTQYLHKNYRNTRPIIALATRFANKSTETNEDGLVAPSVDPDQCVRLAGSEAVLLTKQTRQDEVDRVVRVVGDLLDGNWFGDPISPLKPSEIGIIYRCAHGLIHGLRDRLETLRQGCPVVWLTEEGKRAKGRIGEPGVKILTMHSSKGLQFKAVLVLFAGDCPADFPGTTEDEERRLFYVALTRAEDYLAISCSRNSPFIAEIQAAGAQAGMWERFQFSGGTVEKA